MSRLLTPDHTSGLQHSFQYIPVSDPGHIDRDPVGLHRLMKSDIAHYGHSHAVILQPALLFQHPGADRNGLVSVHNSAQIINRNETVRISVKGQPDVCSPALNLFLKVLRMG